MGVPLQEVPRSCEGDDEAGAHAIPGGATDELGGGLGPSPGELGQHVAPTAKKRPQQARDGQHHVTVRDRSEQLLAQPLGPEELLLLLARGAEAAGGTGATTGSSIALARPGARQTRWVAFA